MKRKVNQLGKKMKKLTIAAVTIVILITLMAVILLEMNNAQFQTPIKVACVGDSLTEGSGYPEYLWMRLGANYTVENFGYPGAAISNKSHAPYIIEDEFEKAKAFQPNIIIIMLGTNDALPKFMGSNSTFIADYKTLIQEFKNIPTTPKIWIAKPPPIFHNGTGLSTETFDNKVIPSIQQVATETQLPIIDVYSALITHPEYFGDGVHVNAEGAKTIANQIYNAIVST